MRTLTTRLPSKLFYCFLLLLPSNLMPRCRPLYCRPNSPFGSVLLCPATGFRGVVMLGDPVFLRNRYSHSTDPGPGCSKHANGDSNSKRRDHAKLDFSMSILMPDGRERCAVSHILSLFYITFNDLLYFPGCRAQRAAPRAPGFVVVSSAMRTKTQL